MSQNGEVWVGNCPHCGRTGLVLSRKHKEIDPAKLYCPECREECLLSEIKWSRL